MGRPKELMVGFQTEVVGYQYRKRWLEMYSGSEIAPGFLLGLYRQEMTVVGLDCGQQQTVLTEEVLKNVTPSPQSSTMEREVCQHKRNCKILWPCSERNGS